MEKKDIIKHILSKDAGRLAEAKQGIKDILTAKASEFRTGASAFIGRKIFESTVNETHTLNGPFKSTTMVADTLVGIQGDQKAAPGGSAHINASAPADKDKSNYGPESVPRLKQPGVEDNTPAAIKALQGKTDTKG